MKRSTISRALLAMTTVAMLGTGMMSAKKMLGHTDFDAWKSVKNYSISRNGEWASFATVPQEGDAVLTFYNSRTGKRIEIERGYNPSFTADSRYAVALIKAHFADTRKAKIDKKKGLDLPQDSLAIIDLKTGHIEKTARVRNYKIGEKGGQWLAYQSVDTLHAKLKDLKDTESGYPLVVRNLAGPQRKIVKWVDNFTFSKDGKKLALTIKKPEKDTLATNGVGLINLPDTAFYLINRDMRSYGAPVFDEAGMQLAFTASNDSVKSGTKETSLFVSNLSKELYDATEYNVLMPSRKGPHYRRPHAADPELQAQLMAKYDTLMRNAHGELLMLNQYSKPEFSHNGKRLVIGVAPKVAPNDTTIVDFENPTLDIWRWDAPYTIPVENKNVEKLRELTFPVVINLATGHQQLIDANPLADVVAPDRWDGDWALLLDPTEDIISRQWDYTAPVQMYSVNVNDGHRHSVGVVPGENSQLSPNGRFVIWFDGKQYHCYDNETSASAIISDKAPTQFWDIDDDHPNLDEAYGIAGWAADNSAVLVYDKYDIWSLDPTGKREPFCLTANAGKNQNRKYRYVNLDPERRMLSKGDNMVLSVFDYTDKRNGVAMMSYGKPATPSIKILDKASFTQLRKALDKDVYTWQKASFDIMPNIWIASSNELAKGKQITDANPQQKEYSWGTAQLFKWRTYSGAEAEGVLYLPEDYDPSKSYPMLSVFYETSAEDLYSHYTMEPSWSWVNYPFYVSRGYVVFVPGIKYTAGVPGECAYDYVCSGVEAVCKAYPAIDKSRLGIDGQSWGGYQTAYLVTRTNMFACAGSGAPVSNMTSAYGGIRWGTGDSRQAQYEMGQSRIGRNLWEAPELYIANSPVFHANRVETPLLIMHNDEDGAVPWYQGIEYFMALRRLGKPVWMLNYNGEAHNIKERRNRKDITVRLQQFFDHYLKGEPMPKWMKEGIPSTRKGQILNYEY